MIYVHIFKNLWCVCITFLCARGLTCHNVTSNHLRTCVSAPNCRLQWRAAACVQTCPQSSSRNALGNPLRGDNGAEVVACYDNIVVFQHQLEKIQLRCWMFGTIKLWIWGSPKGFSWPCFLCIEITAIALNHSRIEAMVVHLPGEFVFPHPSMTYVVHLRKCSEPRSTGTPKWYV